MKREEEEVGGRGGGGDRDTERGKVSPLISLSSLPGRDTGTLLILLH